MSISLNTDHLKGFIEPGDYTALEPAVQKAHEDLTGKTGAGNDFLGWVDLPSRIEENFLKELKTLGEEVRQYSDCIVSIGIGGSYLGIRAAEAFLRGGAVPIYYAGHNMSADYHFQLLEKLKNKNPTVVVISKSGTTTEPALAFRILKDFLKQKYSPEELKKRIICVTDKEKGALRHVADKEGYRSYVIPDDVGGRFSVLTPVGLVPLGLAGIDIQALVEGARSVEKEYAVADLTKNIAYKYAATRFLLYKKGRVIETIASFYDNVFYVLEWWKQLFGESEGKDGKGIFPGSLILSSDLHSMGQLMQDGMRNMFETFIHLEKTKHALPIPEEPEDMDRFNVVAGKDLNFVNTQARKATAVAHFEGGVPNMLISLASPDAYHLGQLFYFFEKAVGISGYLLQVNPFDQPGVEAYKSKMFELLGKK